MAILAAILFYPICKWIYGGFYKRDPEKYPINPKTRLAKGDMGRFGNFFLLFGVVALLGSFFLVWYEGSWGPEYYLETYGADIFKIMIQCIWGIAAVSGLLTIILYFRAKKTEK